MRVNFFSADSRKSDPDGGDILCDSDISSVTGVEKGVCLILGGVTSWNVNFFWKGRC